MTRRITLGDAFYKEKLFKQGAKMNASCIINRENNVKILKERTKIKGTTYSPEELEWIFAITKEGWFALVGSQTPFELEVNLKERKNPKKCLERMLEAICSTYQDKRHIVCPRSLTDADLEFWGHKRELVSSIVKNHNNTWLVSMSGEAKFMKNRIITETNLLAEEGHSVSPVLIIPNPNDLYVDTVLNNTDDGKWHIS